MNPLLGIAILLLVTTHASCGEPERPALLEPLKYNHPGLVVDLGVGLWAWPLPMDFDGDGDLDMVVSCPDKPYNGIYFFENPGGGGKMPVFKPAVRVGNGVQNAQISYVDGKPRVMTPGKEWIDFQKATFEKSRGVATPKFGTPGKEKLRANQWRFADYDGDGVADLIIGREDWADYGWDNAFDKEGTWTRGPLHGRVWVFRNGGTNAEPTYENAFEMSADGKPLDVFGMPSPSFADFDGDGDLDLICGEFLDGFTYFQNTGTRKAPVYAAGRRLPVKMDLEMITPVAIDWDGDGDQDLICGDEDGRVALIEHTGAMEDGLPKFLPPAYFRQQADAVKFGALATPVGVDWDGDGDDDLVSGNSAGYIGFIENLGGNPPKWAEPVRLQADGKTIRILAGPNGSIQGPAEAKWGYTTLSVADWNHDGLPDIVVNSIWGKIEWFRNVGTRQKPALAAAQPVAVEWPGETPSPAWNWWKPKGKELVTQWRTTPLVADLTGDGLNDLAILDTEGYLALFERKKVDGELKLLPGRRAFSGEPSIFNSNHKPTVSTPGLLKLNNGSAGGSGRRKLCLVDWDGDGKLDLLANSVNASFMKNATTTPGEIVFKDAGLVDGRVLAGHDTSPTTVDWDKNGIPDLVLGAEDGMFYTLTNPRAAPAPASSAKAPQPGVVSSEALFTSAPFPQCHASTIVESKGALLCAYFGGTREMHPDVGIWISRFENGKWAAPVEIANGVESPEKRYPAWNPVFIQPKEGPLLLFYKVGPDPKTWWGLRMTSDDGGKTWSKPERLADGILGPIKNKPVQLANGDLLSPTSSEHDGWRVYFERSTDLGKTWSATPPVNGREFGAIQPSVLLLGGDKLLAVGRTQQGVVFQIGSEDNGATWGKMTATALPNPNSGTDAVTLRDGRHLIVYNHTKKGRHPLNVAVSADGKEWQAAAVLETEPGEYSYPAVIQTADGLVHISYTWKRKTIKHAVIDPAKLQARPFVDGEWPK